MLLYWLWLANRPNVSDGVKCALMRQFSDPQDVYFASEEELRQVPGMTRQALDGLETMASKGFAGAIDGHTALFYGVCNACRNKEDQ